MKKTFKLIGMCLMAFAMGMSFAACNPGDDDDNNGNTPGGGTGGGTGGNRYAMSASGRNIQSMSFMSQLTFSFTYDAQGRVVQDVIEIEGSRIVNSYEYGDGIITATYSEDGEVYGTRTLTLTDGLITSAVGEYEGETESMTFQYDGRKLVGFTYDGESYTFEWTDGNITSSPGVFSEGTENSPHTYNTELVSNDRLELIYCGVMVEEFGLLLQGYYGDGTKNRLNTSSAVMEGMPVDFSYIYTFDADNELSSIDLSVMGYPLGMPTTVVWE